MTDHLLDASVVIAATDGQHIHHERVLGWFHSEPGPLAVCPVVEGALVRYLVRTGVAASQALHIVGDVRGASEVTFWTDDVSYLDVDPATIGGHRQVTDAYLVALTKAHGGLLATLDEGLVRAHPDGAVLVPELP